MSRIGKQTVTIPAGVEVAVNGSTVSVKGPQGSLERTFRDEVEIKVDGSEINFAPKSDSRFAQAMWGTVASHVANMVTGVTEKFSKKMIVDGVGYRAEVKGKQLAMALGFSHPVEMDIPEGLEVTVEKNEITVTGVDKELVGLFSNQVRSKKKPEPYKQKGIHYEGEKLKKKESKKAA